MIERLVLVRHGETAHNVSGVAQGWNDSPLSGRGERQVAQLAERLAQSGADAIYSSPLGRALVTAAAIARTTGLPVTTIDELREMSYGTWEGRSFLEVRRDDAAAYHRWIEDPDAPCPDGESHNDVRKRLEVGLAKIRGARNPIVVSHGTAIRIAVTVLLQLPVSAARQFAQDNASLNVFVLRADRFVLKVWNDTAHCENGA